MFKQAGVHFFKQRIVLEMDESIGDIKSEITDRQRCLLLQLEDALLDRCVYVTVRGVPTIYLLLVAGRAR